MKQGNISKKIGTFNHKVRVIRSIMKKTGVTTSISGVKRKLLILESHMKRDGMKKFKNMMIIGKSIQKASNAMKTLLMSSKKEGKSIKITGISHQMKLGKSTEMEKLKYGGLLMMDLAQRSMKKLLKLKNQNMKKL